MLGGYVGLVDSHLSVPQEMPCLCLCLSWFSYTTKKKTMDGRSLNLHFLTCLTATVCAAREFHPCGARAVFFFLFLPFRCVLHPPPPPPLIIFDSCQTVLFFILHRRRRRKKKRRRPLHIHHEYLYKNLRKISTWIVLFVAGAKLSKALRPKTVRFISWWSQSFISEARAFSNSQLSLEILGETRERDPPFLSFS